MAETKRRYDPVKRREYYLRTRELKGRRPTRYTKKGKGSKELQRDEAARLAAQRELLVLKEKLNQAKAKDSPEYQKLARRYINAINDYRKSYTNAYGQAGETVLNRGQDVANTYRNIGESVVNQGENVAGTYAKVGGSVVNAASELATGRVVESKENKAGKLVTKVLTKRGRRVVRIATGL